MEYNFGESLGVNGVLEMKTICNVTGEVLDTFCDKNVVLNIGKESLLKSFTTLETNQFVINKLTIGNDVGVGGDVLSPIMATANMNQSEMSPLYEVTGEAFTITYPTQTSVRFRALLNGEEVMSNYPTLPNIVYTSAMLTNLGGSAFSYRRFPGRTISSLISVEISWTITLV